MTVNELRDYLAKYTGEGKGDSPVVVCDKRDNPVTDISPIIDAVFLEWKAGTCGVTLFTD